MGIFSSFFYCLVVKVKELMNVKGEGEWAIGSGSRDATRDYHLASFAYGCNNKQHPKMDDVIVISF